MSYNNTKLKKILNNPFLWSFITQAAIILLISFFCFFRGNGFQVYVDVTEGTSLANAYNKYIYTFDDNWGESIAEKQRTVFVTPLFIIHNALRLSPENFIPLKFLYFYILSSFSITIALYIFSKDIKYFNHTKNIRNSIKIFTIVTMSAFLYLFNPWMTNRLMHFFLFGTSFIFPLFFSLSYLYFKKSTKSLILIPLIIGLLIGHTTTTPHTAIFLLLGSTPIFLLALTQRNFKKLITYILLVSFASLLTGAYWIYPFIAYQPIPDRIESLNILSMLSQNASFLRNLQLTGYWWPYMPNIYTNNILSSSVVTIILLLPLFFTFKLFLNKNYLQQKIIIGIMLLIGLLLASANNNMIETIYDFILFETRIGSTIGWAFREPEKLAYLIAFAYSLGFFYSFTAQTKKSLTTRILNILSLAFGSIILILYFTYLLQVTSINLKKVKETPNDYNVVNKYLKSDNEVFNIAVFPQVQRTNWIKTIDSGNYFSNLSIEKPVIPLSEADSRSKFFLNETFTKKSTIPNDISKNINLIGAKYLVLRKDYLGYSSSQFKSALSENTNLEKVLDLDTVSLYKNSQYKSIVTSTNKNIITNYGFKVFDIINNQSDRNIVNTNIIFTDLDNYYDMDISDKNTDFIMDNDGVTDLSILLSKNKKTLYPADELSNVNPSLGWAKLNINNKTHAEAQLYFDNAELNQYQFNNEHEVSFVMIDRVVNNIDEALKSKKYYFNFELHDRYEIQIENNNHNIYFSGENSITQDSWNILTSSKFEIRENNPFYIYAKFTGANDLEPHIKTDFFNGLGERITTRVIYPNEGIFNSAFGIPYGTAYAKISIWTRNITNDNSWNITNLNAYEGNFAISYPANVIKLAQHNCDKCAVYARVFKSGSGGKIGFEIQNKTFEIFTRSIFNKYTWAKIANFDNFNEDEIKIINYDGINSVASIAILDEEELNQNSKKINSILSSTEEKTNYENDVVYYKSDGNTNTENTNITVNKINPTLYEVEMKLDKNDKQTILFLKPFSLGWVTSEGEKSQIGNGFVNKFKISPNKKVQIYHYPQRMFEMGLKISAVASALILLYLLFTSIRNFKKKDKLVG